VISGNLIRRLKNKYEGDSTTLTGIFFVREIELQLICCITFNYHPEQKIEIIYYVSKSSDSIFKTISLPILLKRGYIVKELECKEFDAVKYNISAI